MRPLLFLALCVTLVLGSYERERAGRTIPVHIPMQTIVSNETFDVPYWLGAFAVTAAIEPTIWVLPLTIGNGGQAYPGQFLFIRNYGPEDILLYAQNPETIEGSTFIRIPADTVIGLLSGYPAWVVTSPSSVNVSLDNIVTQNIEINGDVFWHDEGPLNLGNLKYIYTFVGDDWFTLEVGTEVYNVPNNPLNVNVVSIGTRAGQNNVGNSVVNLGSRAGENNTRANVNNIGFQAGQYNTGPNVNNLGQNSGQNSTGTNVNNLGQNSGQVNIGTNVNNLGQNSGYGNSGTNVNNFGVSSGGSNTGNSVNNLGPFSGQFNTQPNVNNLGSVAGRYNTGTSVNNLGQNSGENNTAGFINNIGYYAGQRNSGYYTNNLGQFAGQYNTGTDVNNLGRNAGQNNTGNYCSHNGVQAGITNTFDHCYTNGRDSTCTAANQFVFGSATYPLQLRLPSNTGSFCMGTAYDTCLNYGRAGAWELPSGQDLYSTGYFCAGAGCTSSAPVAASTGLYDSNTRVVRSCSAGPGILCSVTDGVLSVQATIDVHAENDSLKKRVELLETQMAKMSKLLQLAYPEF